MSKGDFLNWAERAPWRVSIIGWDREKLLDLSPQYFIVSNLEYIHPLRLKRPSAVEFWQTLEQRYKLERVFKRELRFLGLSFPFLPKVVPEDILYTFPEIRIYKLKANPAISSR